MGESEDNMSDDNGFERWGLAKKPKKKPRTRSGGIRSENATRTSTAAAKTRVPQRRVVLSRKTTETNEEKCWQKKSKKATNKSSEENGTFVITEKEYELFQSLKNNVVATPHANSTDVDAPVCASKKPAYDGSGGSWQTKESSCRIQNLGCQPRQVLKRRAKIEEEVDEQSTDKGKEVNAVASRTVQSAKGNEIEMKRQQKRAVVTDPKEEFTSDSDFQRISKKCIGGGANAEAACGRNVQAKRIDLDDMTPRYLSRVEIRSSRIIERTESEDERVQEERVERATLERGSEGLLRSTTIARDSSRQKTVIAAKKTSFFPFEEVVQKEDLPRAGQLGWSRHGVQDDRDDDFNEAFPHLGGSNKKMDGQMLTESEARADRKRRKVEREVGVRKRAAAGQKPFYIMVSSTGTPYGDIWHDSVEGGVEQTMSSSRSIDSGCPPATASKNPTSEEATNRQFRVQRNNI